MATSMVGLFTHKQVAPAWYSPVTVIPLALLLIGLSYSFWTSGGEITEWYFVNYQCLFLFWPWNFELRFQLPIAPLAALYMWRGGGVLLGWTRRMPRTIGIVCAVLAAVGFLSSAIWGRGVRHPSALACIAIWILAGCLSAVLLGGGQRLIQRLFSLLTSTVSLGRAPVSRAALGGGIVMMCLVAAGTWMQVAAGLNNLHRVPEMNPNIEAAEWIRDQERRRYSGDGSLGGPRLSLQRTQGDLVPGLHRSAIAAGGDSAPSHRPHRRNGERGRQLLETV